MSLPCGATIGILGDGQLGRMLASAAARLGFRTVSFGPGGEHSPAAQVTGRHFAAGYEDVAALKAFAETCDTVTVEFENVPVSAAEAVIAAGTPFHPGPNALSVAQDRAMEKRFLEEAGILCAPWRLVDSLADLEAAHAALGPDAILKTRREGYDGKGQVRLSAGSDLAAAWREIGERACVLEGFVDFALETSAIVARGTDGGVAVYPPSQNLHEGGILRRSMVPAPISVETEQRAQALAVRLAEQLDYIGVLALEFFVMQDGRLLANEFAPRVHNSGHWTPEACATGQFENHIRAVAGWPLGETALLYNAEMENLIGEAAGAPVADLLSRGSLTLYGKREIRPGRKMGHLVRIRPL
ncbi:MAG: 5-(carboxyamino)imidazole ribonucleotide synthase [Hyphomonadaceae bacterium]|nr:5-(carboxyamino)imidazole ribonucleotide synthase [Hyphomonadaceae bacterium]